MKLLIKNLTDCKTSIEDLQDQSETVEVEIKDPRATLLNLRASVSVQFRLPVNGFWFYVRPPTKPVDFSDEKKMLSATGLADMDVVYIYSKSRPKDSVLADLTDAAVDSGMKRPRPEEAEEERVAPEKKADAPTATTEAPATTTAELAQEKTTAGQDSEEELEDDVFLFDEEKESVADMYEKLVDYYPEQLKQLRERFLHSPQEIMTEIQTNHPDLFLLISKHQEAFLELMNNEQLVESLQDGELVDNEDEEFDEEQLGQLDEMIMAAMQDGGADGAALRQLLSGEDGGDMDEEEGEGDDGVVLYGGDDMKRIADFEPTEEDEKKIQELVQLGFTYEQCKYAFYKCHRSVERAANMLFEQPPQL
ncbi:XPC-binding domain/UBA/TS-N domain containing protein, putative [Angomonas deanei]|uniref:XPC-binding domain/UBA/TS-N domain containing protein, putative n=1 Tax=Angomonas deanei TaxID=59799 RepID=A0A7G2CHU8_9TRYP|nr:XPC-binding domain/UBA/TS-N domain containing protein, putative [Angomonas deanei]